MKKMVTIVMVMFLIGCQSRQYIVVDKDHNVTMDPNAPPGCILLQLYHQTGFWQDSHPGGPKIKYCISK